MTLEAFRPLLRNPHAQTILAHLIRRPGTRGPRSEPLEVPLGDGDRLVLAVSTPAGWNPGDTTVVLVHGLTGSEDSTYMIRMARRLLRRGIRAVRFNMRGCGRGKGLARRPYYAGCSHDVQAALEQLRRDDPRGRHVLAGFSLGGNVVLKLAGELGEQARDLVDEVVAFNPPVDLAACCRRVMRRECRLYERHFVAELRRDVNARLATFPDLPRVDLPAGLSLFEFDDLYTARQWGYRGAVDYYARASSGPLLERIAVPTRIVQAEDDPIIDAGCLDGLSPSSQVHVHRVAHGGHIGYLSRPTRRGIHWMDTHLFRWVLGR